jgi:orotidine-5'-phosphate decarboxylase
MVDSRLIVALDTNDMNKIDWLLNELHGLVNFYKIGMQLVYSGHGLKLAERLIKNNVNVFMDLKLLDIEHTVEMATKEIANLGVTFLTVHGYPQAIESAVKGANGTNLKILAVSVLTSYNDKDLRNSGYLTDVNTLVVNRTIQAKNLGAGGVISSPLELQLIKYLGNNEFKLVTPGIRLDNDSLHDQKRISTPNQAILNGANHIVIGRPIVESKFPRKVVEEILSTIK